jgi:DNA-binding MarR family transcriptional regulator
MTNRDAQEQAVIQQLRIIFRAVQSHSRLIEKACGVSSAQLWMLHEISTASGIRVSELANVLCIHPSTCSNMLDKLEKKELVYRERSLSDQRAVKLHITEKGESVLLLAPSPPQGKLSETLSRLSNDHLLNLEDGLQVLIEALHFDDEKAGLTPIP